MSGACFFLHTDLDEENKRRRPRDPSEIRTFSAFGLNENVLRYAGFGVDDVGSVGLGFEVLVGVSGIGLSLCLEVSRRHSEGGYSMLLVDR